MEQTQAFLNAFRPGSKGTSHETDFINFSHILKKFIKAITENIDSFFSQVTFLAASDAVAYAGSHEYFCSDI